MLQRATWLAATLGPFDPADLIGHVTQDPVERRALAVQLAPLCAEVSTPSSVLWSLHADPRRRALNEMQQIGELGKPQLPDYIENVPLAPSDQFGRYLRDALTGNVTFAGQNEIQAQYSAYEFVGRANVGAKPEQARESAALVEQHAQRVAADERLTLTVGPVFVGRVKELEALRQFALTGAVDNGKFKLKGARRNKLAPPTPMVFVSGVGGAGKSALISRVVQLLREHDSQVAAAAVLDFDRPTIASLDRVRLSLELIRQISLSQPRIAGELTQLRRTALNEFSDLELQNASDEHGFRRDSRALYSIHSRLQSVLVRAGLNQRSFVIILDTFEEVLTLGVTFVEAIYSWVEDLRRGADLTSLRVVISGRALPSDLHPQSSGSSVEDMQANVVAKIRLADLSQREAVELLMLRGVEASLAPTLIEKFGRNPLVLRLLSDYVTQSDADTKSLLRDKKRLARYRADVAQRILYSRIIGRIRDEPAVKALASPGLVVRVVTPGIIKKVLATPCGLGAITQERAEELFEKLAAQVWLVNRMNPGAVSHRRDVRSLMLPLVTEPEQGKAKAPLARQIQQIHKNAARYFQTVADPDLSSTVHRTEFFYHQLFVDPDAAYGHPDFERALPGLASDLADFPIAQRARLKIELGKALTVEEVERLDEAGANQYRRYVHGLTTRTSGTAPRRRSRATKSQSSHQAVSRSGPLAPQEESVVVAFANGRFGDVAAVSDVVLTEFLTRAAGKSSGKGLLLNEMSSHVTWIAALATLSQQPEDRSGARSEEWLETFCERLLQSWSRLAERYLQDYSNLSLTHYLTAVAILLDRGRPLYPSVHRLLQRIKKETGGKLELEITSTASLRIFQLLTSTLPDSGLELNPGSVDINCLQYFAGLLDPGFAQKHDSSMHSAQRAWQMKMKDSTLPSALSSLLGVVPGNANTGELSSLERAIGSTRIDTYGWRPLAPFLRAGRGITKRSGHVVASARHAPIAWALLRGMAPDMQAPMLAGLSDLVARDTDLASVLATLERSSRWWPRDFAVEGAKFGRRTPTSTFLTTVCHFADRFSALPLLLRQAKRETFAWQAAQVYSRYLELISLPLRVNRLGAGGQSRTS